MAVPHPRPIFVLGNQKSGTTAIASLLATALGERYSHDMSFTRKWQDIERICNGCVTVRELVRRAPRDFAAGVIKNPDYTFIYRSLADHFEAARFVLVIRDPRQNIRSILNRLAIPGHLETLSPGEWQKLEAAPAWKRVFDARSQGLTHEQYISVLAARWRRCLETVLGGQDRVTLVRYEDFTRDKWTCLLDLADSLGRPVVADARHMLDRQFQPAGMSNSDPLEFFGRRNLASIESICAEHMKTFRYAPMLLQ
ncbi:MAG: sulfotransferase [Actinomycetota bacterium]